MKSLSSFPLGLKKKIVPVYFYIVYIFIPILQTEMEYLGSLFLYFLTIFIVSIFNVFVNAIYL